MQVISVIESSGKVVLGLLLLLHGLGLLQEQFGYWLLLLCAFFLLGTGAWELYKLFGKSQTL